MPLPASPRRCSATLHTGVSPTSCPTRCRTGTTGFASCVSSALQSSRTSSSAPPFCWNSVGASGRLSTSLQGVSFSTAIPFSSRPTWRCVMRGSVAASSGTSAPRATHRSLAPRSLRLGSRALRVFLCCASTNGSAFARFPIRSMLTCPMARRSSLYACGSSIPMPRRCRCTGGPTSPCPRLLPRA